MDPKVFQRPLHLISGSFEISNPQTRRDSNIHHTGRVSCRGVEVCRDQSRIACSPKSLSRGKRSPLCHSAQSVFPLIDVVWCHTKGQMLCLVRVMKRKCRVERL